MASGRRYQLAQLSGVSPPISLASIFRSGVQKDLNRFLGTESCSAMEGRFGPGSAIAHEAAVSAPGLEKQSGFAPSTTEL